MSVTRRTLIVSSAFVPLARLTAASLPTALNAAQMKTLEAFIDRLIPADELGPGAVEAGAQLYIDRALAGPNAGEKAQFIAGLNAVDSYAQRTHGAALGELSAEKRDEILHAIDDGKVPQLRNFFSRVRRMTFEGMFGDPYHGGNRNFAGWNLLRYPGPRTAVTVEMQSMKQSPKDFRNSAWGSQYK